MTQVSVAVVGASGYSGAELVSLLLRHPGVRLGGLYAQSSAGKRVEELYPALRGRIDAAFQPLDIEHAARHDAVFIALPSGEALHLAPLLLSHGTRVIDLGGDFRLRDTAAYKQYYKRDHTAHDVLKTAVYGFPEWHASSIRTARLLSNPGCYPTSAILPIAPLVMEGLIAGSGIVVNSLSGVSGAGRSASVDMSFGEVNESVKAYKVGVHQHTPEIQQALSDLSGSPVTVTFVPHLLPITRGILTTIVAPLTAPISSDRIADAYRTAYASAPFVRLIGERPAEIKSVNYTNYIDIGWKVYPENGHAIIMASIDNLRKGAAGQAVQSFNIMFGFSETEGLV